QRDAANASGYPEWKARGVCQRLCCLNPLIAPPELRSKQELIDHVSRGMWKEAKSQKPSPIERDTRWERAICERSAALHDGWIAVVVGWQHANPQENSQWLRGLLIKRGFCVNSVYLGP